MKLLAATGNKLKLAEFRRILTPLGVEVLSLADVGQKLDVEETGATFMENAEIKARALRVKTGLPTVADDSGLCIDALNGRPGVYSARYGGADTPHSRKIEMILDEMRDIPDEKRTARFVAAICCVWDDDTVISCEGAVEGRIGHGPTGANGFGYDPVFMVGNRSFAQFADREKDAVSHRGRALRTFYEKLEAHIRSKRT
ncbi:MAG: RdgB/HAM1 family non-canonical purine NTP pyrophosphatase [Oscillospiraceae bacterium]|jgi:XTP/dITP diphosphohydrolase|nr:RdgB/HAM1 family non-canonical purine NTP pyrophosphatase [Oscillospiraceae bacterium]